MTRENYDLLFPTEEMNHQMTLEALASVDAGRGISHEAMRAWAKSVGTDNPLPLPQPEARAAKLTLKNRFW